MIFRKEDFGPAVRLWAEWNERINVVSRKDVDNLFEHHILHSLAIFHYLTNIYVKEHIAPGDQEIGVMAPGGNTLLDKKQVLPGFSQPRVAQFPEGTACQRGNIAFESDNIASRRETFLDVGCGGGFPGVPLAMVMPEAEFTLCDSIGKKVKVAQAVADGLGLKNVRCVNARAEDLPGQFDWVVSRAVTSLDNFYPWVKGRFRKGILYLKGGDVNEEIAQMCRKCGVNPAKVSVWPVSDWLDDDYFAEKFVIHIRK